MRARVEVLQRLADVVRIITIVRLVDYVHPLSRYCRKSIRRYARAMGPCLCGERGREGGG